MHYDGLLGDSDIISLTNYSLFTLVLTSFKLWNAKMLDCGMFVSFYILCSWILWESGIGMDHKLKFVNEYVGLILI